MAFRFHRYEILSPGVLLVVAIAVASALAWRLFNSSERPEAPLRAPIAVDDRSSPRRSDDDWTGSRKCAECHHEIWEKYQSHPMARSSAAVADAEIIEDYEQHTSFSKPESRTYHVERVDDQVWHHESMTDADGNVIYDQSVEVHFAIGSGKRGRTYLIERGSLLKASPITWYTQEGLWDLSPGYRPGLHQRFDRRAVDECVACHVGRVSADRDKPNRFNDPPFLEAAIGCERCHGPGGDHVRRHESGADESAGLDSIVNPGRLAHPEREDVCNQCHLLGDRILRYGRTTYDFRPGERLEENWTIFSKESPALSDESTRAVGQVDQMRDSVCYKSSEGRMGCTSCHDPHSTPAPPDRQQHYDNHCAACHSKQGCKLPEAERLEEPAAGSCIACHMPPMPASNVPHTSQTDHRILRRAGKPMRAPMSGTLEMFDNAEARLPPIDLARARGLFQARQQLVRRGNRTSAAIQEAQLRRVLSEYPDDAPVQLTLATLCMLQHRPGEAQELWLDVLNKSPENELALRSLAQFEQERGDFAESITLLKRLLAIDQHSAELHGVLAELLWKTGRREEAVTEAQAGLSLDPRLIPLRKWLAGSYRQLGLSREADDQDRILERMQNR